MATNEVDLTDVQIEPHGLRNVEFTVCDFRRRMLDKYGQCTKMAVEVAAVETTCKALARLVGESNDIISIVYGINTLKVARITDLTVDSIDQCYMDAAMDATKRLSVCTDIYYKNKDASTQHQDLEGDGETGGTGVGVVKVQFAGKNAVEYGELNALGPITLFGDVTGEIDVTLTPRNATVSGLASVPEQLINADMVYELSAHTLSAINADLVNLQLKPNATGTAYLEIRVDGNIAKTLSFTVVDNTDLDVNTTVNTVYVDEATDINPIIFSGLMQSAVEITVEPINCAITGFKSRPTLAVTSGSSYSFASDNLTAINNELVDLKVLATAIGFCQVKVTYPGGSKTFQYAVEEPVVLPTAELTFAMPTDGDVKIILGERNPIPAITATGLVRENTTITVTPTNCSLSGFLSDPDHSYCENASYTFTVADVDSVNHELATLNALPVQVGEANITVSFNDGLDTHVATFPLTVQSVPVNVIVPVVDTCSKIASGDFTPLKPVIFRGRLEKPTTRVTLSTVNALVKGVSNSPETEYSEEAPCTATASSLSELNGLFANLSIKPLHEGGARLIFLIDNIDTYTFSFDIEDISGSEDDYTNFVSLQGNAADDTLVMGTYSDTMALVFSSVVDTGMVITVKPRNCRMKNVKSTPSVEYSYDDPCVITAVSRSAINEEFGNIQIKPITTSNVGLEISVNGESINITFNDVVDEEI